MAVNVGRCSEKNNCISELSGVMDASAAKKQGEGFEVCEPLHFIQIKRLYVLLIFRIEAREGKTNRARTTE